MTKKNTPKFVTEATFRKHARSVDKRFEGLQATVDRIAVKVVQHESDIQEIKVTMMTRDMGQEILKQISDFSARYEESERASRIHLNQLMEFRPVLNDHEKRLVVLEQHVSPKS
jgi:hypothetical protein